MKRLLGLFTFLLLCTICVAQDLTVIKATVDNNKCWSPNNKNITLTIQNNIKEKEFIGTIYVRATKEGNTSIYQDFGLELDLPAGQKSDRSYNTADFSNEGNISLEEGNYTLSYHLPQGTIRYEETDSTTFTVRYCQDTPVGITVGASGFSTVILPYEVFPIPNGLKVYNIIGITDEELTLEVDNLMHANTPYFIRKPADEIVGALAQAYTHDINRETTNSWVEEIETLAETAQQRQRAHGTSCQQQSRAT